MILDEPEYNQMSIYGKNAVSVCDPKTHHRWGFVYMDTENYRIVAERMISNDPHDRETLYCDSLETASMWLRGLI